MPLGRPATVRVSHRPTLTGWGWDGTAGHRGTGHAHVPAAGREEPSRRLWDASGTGGTCPMPHGTPARRLCRSCSTPSGRVLERLPATIRTNGVRLGARQGEAREASSPPSASIDAMRVHVSHSPKAGNFGAEEMIARGLVDGITEGELVEAMSRLLGDALIRANEAAGWSGSRNRLTGLRRVAPRPRPHRASRSWWSVTVVVVAWGFETHTTTTMLRHRTTTKKESSHPPRSLARTATMTTTKGRGRSSHCPPGW